MENGSLRASLGAEVPERVQRIFDASDGRSSTDRWWRAVWPAAEEIKRNRALGLFCVPLDGRDEVLHWNWLDGTGERSEGTLYAFLANMT